jgi:hypothetical protein
MINPSQGQCMNRTHTRNKRRQTSMSRVGFEPSAPVFERAKTDRVLDREAIFIGSKGSLLVTFPVLAQFAYHPSVSKFVTQRQYFSITMNFTDKLCWPLHETLVIILKFHPRMDRLLSSKCTLPTWHSWMFWLYSPVRVKSEERYATWREFFEF